jgi:hypothetical protein
MPYNTRSGSQISHTELNPILQTNRLLQNEKRLRNRKDKNISQLDNSVDNSESALNSGENEPAPLENSGRNNSIPNSHERRTLRNRNVVEELATQASLSHINDITNTISSIGFNQVDADTLQYNININVPEVNSSKFVEGFSDTTLLIDVPFSKFGTFLGLSNSLTYIPDKLVKKVRSVYIFIMQKLVNSMDLEDEPTQISLWKKWLLLPIVLFCHPSKCNKRCMNMRMERILADDWSSFQLGSYVKREEIHIDRSNIIPNESFSVCTVKRIQKFVQVNQLGSAMDLITLDNRKVIPSVLVFQKLSALHPVPGDSGLTDVEIQQIDAFSNESNLIVINRGTVIEVLRKQCKKGIKHGLSKLRFEHLQQLFGKGPEYDDKEVLFGDLFSKLLSKIANVDVPKIVFSSFFDTELFAAPKKSNDVRPISINDTMIKLVKKVMFKITSEFNRDFFVGIQYALKSNGAEEIVHTLRAAFELNPDYDTFALDGENAFNKLNRKQSLFQIKQNFPMLLPLLRENYGISRNCWYYGLEDAIKPVASQEGMNQGDVLATWGYCVGIHSFLQNLRDILGLEGFVKFFCDDGNIHVPFDQMKLALQYIKEHGPRYGYFIKHNKGRYLLGKCPDIQTANERMSWLKNYGLAEDILFFHPDNVELDPVRKEKAILEYGVNILGSFIGTDEYVTKCLAEKTEVLRSIKDKLINFPNYQIRSLLFRKCFNSKVNYLHRTIPTYLMKTFNLEFDCMRKEIFASLINSTVDELPDDRWVQARLNIKEGGFGLRFVDDVSKSAYVASFSESYAAIRKDHPEFAMAMATSAKSFSCFKSMLLEYTALQNDINMNTIFDIKCTVDTTLQYKLTDMMVVQRINVFKSGITDNSYLSWLTSLSSAESGKWLDAIPKFFNTTFSDSLFTIMFCNRLYMKHSCIDTGKRCDCARNVILDAKGHHFISGCPKHNMIKKQHDILNYELKRLLEWSGLSVIREEVRCFQAVNPESNDRPDLTIRRPPKRDKPLVIDTVISNPVPGSMKAVPSVLTKNKASKVNRANELAFQKKNEHYKELATANGFGFLPFAFESTGRIHPKTMEFLQEVGKYAAEYRKISYSIVINYILTCISSTLQREIANNIQYRAFKINGSVFEANSITNNILITASAIPSTFYNNI